MTRFYPNWWLVADVRHPFFASARPLVFAHRGGSGLAPENTIAAFDTALALGADGLELDVRLSKTASSSCTTMRHSTGRRMSGATSAP
jgi:glycerophosphoryl diester phosphodiesterase